MKTYDAAPQNCLRDSYNKGPQHTFNGDSAPDACMKGY